MNNIGYYFTLSKEYGDYLDAVSPWVNWAHIHTATWPRDKVEKVADRCVIQEIQVMYSVQQILFYSPPGGPYRLFPNWQERFDYHIPWYNFFKDREILHSLYIMDEPTGNGISAAELHLACDYIRGKYPMMIIEDSRAICPDLPEVEYFGATCYTPRPFSEAEELIEDPRVNVIVAQSFNEKPHQIPDQWQWYSLYKKIENRPGAMMALFTYPSYEHNGKKYIGSQDDNGVKAVHAQIGKEIIHG